MLGHHMCKKEEKERWKFSIKKCFLVVGIKTVHIPACSQAHLGSAPAGPPSPPCVQVLFSLQKAFLGPLLPQAVVLDCYFDPFSYSSSHVSWKVPELFGVRSTSTL